MIRKQRCLCVPLTLCGVLIDKDPSDCKDLLLRAVGQSGALQVMRPGDVRCHGVTQQSTLCDTSGDGTVNAQRLHDNVEVRHAEGIDPMQDR